MGYAFCVFQEHINDNILTDIKTLYIDDLCVDEKSRGQHIGKQLYDYVVNYAKKQGCYNVTLNVWECNPNAKKFYELCGLKPQKTGMGLCNCCNFNFSISQRTKEGATKATDFRNTLYLLILYRCKTLSLIS